MFGLRTSSVLLALTLLIICGCDGGTTASISGKATCDGTPLPEGLVVFASDTATCSAKIIDGQYAVSFQGGNSVPIETYAITVFPPDTKFEYNAETDSEEPVPSNVDLSMFSRKYQSTSTSGLTFTPEPGENTFDILISRDAG